MLIAQGIRPSYNPQQPLNICARVTLSRSRAGTGYLMVLKCICSGKWKLHFLSMCTMPLMNLPVHYFLWTVYYIVLTSQN